MRKNVFIFLILSMKLQNYCAQTQVLLVLFIHLGFLLLRPSAYLLSSLRQQAEVVRQELERCATIAFSLHSYHRLLAKRETLFHF